MPRPKKPLPVIRPTSLLPLDGKAESPEAQNFQLGTLFPIPHPICFIKLRSSSFVTNSLSLSLFLSVLLSPELMNHQSQEENEPTGEERLIKTHPHTADCRGGPPRGSLANEENHCLQNFLATQASSITRRGREIGGLEAYTYVCAAVPLSFLYACAKQAAYCS